MKTLFIGSAVALALTTTSLVAAPVHGSSGFAMSVTSQDAQIWLAKEGKGNGNGGNAKASKGKPAKAKGNGNPGKAKTAKVKPGKGKPQNAGGPENKPDKAAKTSNGNSAGAGKAESNGKAARALTGQQRQEVVERIVTTPAPDGRDMLRVLGASGLALVTADQLLADIPDEDVIGYANCPPGLAKKDPPCVPPGLAKKGVTYEEWASYDRDGYDDLWRDRRDEWLDDRNYDGDRDLLLLQSEQITQLFGLDPAPDGQRYALIDGLPVLLDDQDYTSLLLVNELAQLPDALSNIRVAPTAALSQEELISLYRLPQLDEGQNYSVLNGQLLQLNDENYEILQLIRVARAVL